MKTFTEAEMELIRDRQRIQSVLEEIIQLVDTNCWDVIQDRLPDLLEKARQSLHRPKGSP